MSRDVLGKHAGNELSLWDIADLNRTSKALRNFGGFVGGGVMGQGFLFLTDLIRNTDSKSSKELRKRIEKNPELYPFCDSDIVKVLMRCSKCNSSVRADQDGEFCTECGTRIRIPMPPVER